MKFIDLCFCDFEASSLSVDSYPISFGWHSEASKGEFYIAPQDDWVDWNDKSEKIHGISRDWLIKNGKPARVVAQKLNEALSGRVLVSDCARFDKMWLKRLYAAAELQPSFKLVDVESLSYLTESDLVRVMAYISKRSVHDAYGDALLLYKSVYAVTKEKNLL